ncbi:hypothetical protein [Actinomycetospora sp. CA-053990]|uniref:hypothetical protein n=1 Tax=Actinomycetospora sp. CA-053990 TaxID=3239891 RepID=UPI003D8D13C5
MEVRPRTSPNTDGSLPVDRKVTSASAWSYVGGVVAMTLLSALGGLDYTPLPDYVEVFVFPVLGALTTLAGGYFTSSQNYPEPADSVRPPR